jgi:hypothetical protein
MRPGMRTAILAAMHFDDSQIGPYLIAALAVFVVYRRLRRTFGRQALRPRRMGIRIALFAAIGCSILPLSFRSTDFLAAILGGAAAGAALGVWGAKHTRFETYGGALHYVPHTYTGIAVSLLFLGRVVYRVTDLYAPGHSPGFASAGIVTSPLTVGLLLVLVGYYVCYYGLVLWRSRHLKPEDLEIPPVATPP